MGTENARQPTADRRTEKEPTHDKSQQRRAGLGGQLIPQDTDRPVKGGPPRLEGSALLASASIASRPIRTDASEARARAFAQHAWLARSIGVSPHAPTHVSSADRVRVSHSALWYVSACA